MEAKSKGHSVSLKPLGENVRGRTTDHEREAGGRPRGRGCGTPPGWLLGPPRPMVAMRMGALSSRPRVTGCQEQILADPRGGRHDD